MKKALSLIVLAATALTAGAQRTVQGSAFFDNWSVGVLGGATMPVKNSDFPQDVRATYGVEIFKQITPVISLGVQGLAGNNTTVSRNVIDETMVYAMGKVNFSNLFGGYRGKPRPFEVEGLLGVGWAHEFYNSSLGNDVEKMVSKFGLGFNYTFDKNSAWTVNLRPTLMFFNTGDEMHPTFKLSRARAELTAGLTYHFRNQNNGKHHMTLVRAYDQAEVDGLNAKVNDLRGKLAEAEGTLVRQNADISSLRRMLNEERNRKPVTVTETVVEQRTTATLEQTITFKQGGRKVDASQMPNVERIATYLKNHPEASVVIRGYASPEGSAEVNAKIAVARAEAVKTILVEKYRIAASRINAQGQGVGDMFSEPDWNRVSICTIVGDK